MREETVTLFFALLAGALAVLVVAVLVGAVLGSLLLDRAGRLGLVDQLAPVALELAVLVAITATAGSLYLSELAGFAPCRLCWVQRGLMYPAAAALAGALAWRRRRPPMSRMLAWTGAVLAAAGLPVALFHRYEQATGAVGGFCSLDNPCSFRWVNHFGFVTIPTMAAVGFAGILTLVALHLFWRPSP